MHSPSASSSLQISSIKKSPTHQNTIGSTANIIQRSEEISLSNRSEHRYRKETSDSHEYQNYADGILI